MNCRRLFSAAAVALLVSAGTVAVAPFQPAQADQKGPTARPEVGKPVQAAIDLLKAGKVKEALGQIQAADAVSGKTPYETFIVEYVKLQIYAKSNDPASTVRAAEALLGSGQASPEQTVAFLEVIASSEFNLKDCPKAVDATNRYYKSGGTNPAFRKSIAACYLQSGDYPKAGAALRDILKSEPKPSEDDLKTLMGIWYKANPAGQDYFDSLKQLAGGYPNPSYWHDLILFVQKKPGYSDKLELDVDQLKIATKTMTAPEDFMNAAELALQGGFPGLAKNIMDQGFAQGVLGTGGGAARQQRLRDTASAQAASDQRTLTGEAASAHGGSELLKLGDALASYGQYNDAIGAYQKAIAAGSFKTPLEANQAKLHLGIAYINAGQKPKAKDALKQVTGQDGTADLAQLWALQAGL
ncbi:MAG TPA: tetratricopeptide repeat protein [Stellaceae bacterium]|nr:tetratricopeptide repeat protein [Stellaceae bacterium]